MRRIGQHAIIATVQIAGKGADRHQLDGGDAELGKTRKCGLHTGETGEGTDMELVEDAVGPRPTLPFRVPP